MRWVENKMVWESISNNIEHIIKINEAIKYSKEWYKVETLNISNIIE